MRFISFIDILGFADIVDSRPLQQVIGSLKVALSTLPMVQALGVFPGDPRRFDVTAKSPKLNIFSFSDTFVLSSEDDSEAGFFYTIIGTSLLTSSLFGMGLPVRGAITWGEADFIPGTSHLVGKAIIRAARLEKEQEWFGILIDPDILNQARLEILAFPLVKPLVVDYEVPIKGTMSLTTPCKVINWRYNMLVQKGIASLFPKAKSQSAQKKQENTLAFCKWLRSAGTAYGKVAAQDGKELSVPWLTGIAVGDLPPNDPAFRHGDDY